MGAIKNRCQSGTFRKEMKILQGNQGKLLSENWPILPFLQYVQKKIEYNKLKHNENGFDCDNFCRRVKDTTGLDGRSVDNRQPNLRDAQCQQRVAPPLAGWGVTHFTFERTLPSERRYLQKSQMPRCSALLLFVILVQIQDSES